MIAPERIWTASTDGKCHVGFDAPSINYTNEYIRKDASDAAIAAARAEAFIAGANAVHAEWIRAHGAGETPPRWEPDFSESARDYAATGGLTEDEKKVKQMREDFPNGI